MEKSIEVIRDKQVNFILLIASGILIIWQPNLLAYIIGLYLIIAGGLNLALLYKSNRKRGSARKASSRRKR